MFRQYTPFAHSDAHSIPVDLAHWRQQLITRIIRYALPLGTVLVILGTALAIHKRDLPMGMTNLIGLAALFALHRMRHLPAQVKGTGLVLIMVGVGVSFLVNHIGAFGLVWLSAAPLLASLLMGRKVATLLITLISVGVFGAAYWLDLPLAPEPLLGFPAIQWTLLALNYFTVNMILDP